jgi:hypothetical protein
MRRAYKFLLRPTSKQAQALSEMLRDHCSLDTGALQERRDVLDEIKVHQQDNRLVLRSRRPDRVEQEVWGILALHRALRKLIHDAALGEGLDPDRMSFTHTVKIVRRQVVRRAVFPLRNGVAILAAVTAEIAEILVPKRERSNPRVVRRTQRTPFPSKKPIDRHLTDPPPTIVTVLTRT